MLVYVLLREDQSEHGYIDTSIAGVFLDKRVAKEHEALDRLHASGQGLGARTTRVLTASGRSRGVDEELVHQRGRRSALRGLAAN